MTTAQLTKNEQERRRNTALQILRDFPYIYGQQVGFTKLNPLNNTWIQDFVYGTEDETLQAHRQAYKTTSVSVSLTLLTILQPNKTIKFFRKTDTAVKEIMAQVSKMLKHKLTRQLVRDIYGQNVNFKLTVDNALEISTNLKNDPRGTSQLCAGGIKSSITGQHYDIIFTDDIVTIEDRTSKAERELTKTKYQELINIVNAGGRIVNTGTPWHPEDAFTLMPEPQRWDCYQTGIMTPEEIADKKARMLPSLFAANYELKHIAAEDVIFKDPKTGADPAILMNAKYCQIDAAYGGEDFTAFTIGRKTDGKYYLLGKLWRKHVDDVTPEILALKNKFLTRTTLVETNGDKGYLKKNLEKKKDHVLGYWEDTNKFLKIATYLRSEWPDVEFVEGTDPEYIQQICEYNENADHDDAPDSAASLIRHLWSQKPEDKQVRGGFR